MKQYLDLLQHVYKAGEVKGDRTGTGTKSVFGYQMRFDLQEGFPLLTTKKLHIRSILHELIWFLRGDTNIKYLNDNGVSIWDEWADENGDLGPVYGKQWRSWSKGEKCPECNGVGSHDDADCNDISFNTWPCVSCGGTGESTIDQIQTVIESLKNNPDSRRHIVTAWNPVEVEKMALPPCHCLFQFYVANGKLSCQLYQRSVDICLGLPFNIASYAFLTHIIANICNLEVGEFIHTSGDAHIYLNHLEGVAEQLSRDPNKYDLPELKISRSLTDINDINFEDFDILEYNSYPSIKFKIAV